ncbi:MAG: MAPEG family protein [Bdellovibrionales bacterium]|nr:MAPEG family protein [Bdellovibrionales bacterium]
MTIILLFAFIPSSLAKLKSFGGKWVASNRDPVAGKELLPWGARAERAHNNLKDNFPAFAVAILLLGTMNKFDHLTTWAAGLYVAGRLGHFISYTAGNVQLRFVTYILALSANLYLLGKVLAN